MGFIFHAIGTYTLDATIASGTCHVPCQVLQEECIAEILDEVAPHGPRNTCPATNHDVQINGMTEKILEDSQLECLHHPAETGYESRDLVSDGSFLRTRTSSNHHKNAT